MRIRFSLRLLILLMGCTCLYLGARQWRKRTVQELSAQLESEKFGFYVPDEFVDRLWQRNPRVGIIYLDGAGRRISHTVHRTAEDDWGGIECDETIERLERLGLMTY